MTDRLLTREGDVGDLLIGPAAADIGVASREPHLPQVRCVAVDPLPQRRSEGVTGLVECEGLEGVLNLGGDLCVGEFPCANDEC